MTNQIPGVPEGWELVHANRLAEAGEVILTEEGSPYVSQSGSARPFPIIRKIKKPAAYRPFANAEEFKPHRDRWVKVIKAQDERNTDLEDWFGIGSFLKIMGCEESGLWLRVPGGWVTYESAFDCFVFDDDGTPFGVRIDE
jgi:hypothetical protein